MQIDLLIRIRLLVLVLYTMISISSLYCQETDTILFLEPFSIVAEKPNTGLQKTTIEKATIKENEMETLSELISTNTPVFIKTYGQGGLSTASFRGTNATHTQVLWNGFNINSPMLGQLDFSQIPVSFLDEASLYHGGSSLIANSGSLGGSILLKNNPQWENNFSIGLTQGIGSFDTYNTLLDIKVGSRKLQHRSRIVYNTSENDFPYKDNSYAKPYPVKRRANAGYENKAVLQELYFKPGNKNIFSLNIWAQDHSRNIPFPLSVEGNKGSESETYRFFRTLAGWKHLYGKSKLEIKSAFLHDYMHYKRSLDTTNTKNHSSTFSNIAKFKTSFNNAEFFTGLNNENIFVNSANYAGEKSRTLLSFHAGVKKTFFKKLTALVLVRQEYADNKFLPILPSVGFEYQILNAFQWFFKGNASMNHHLPTLNELYWQPGGNPSLSEEKGYSFDMGTSFERQFTGKFGMGTELTYFYSDIHDWIIWYPGDYSIYWSPYNLKNVESQGVELSAKIDYNFHSLKIRNHAKYTYTRATNKKSTSFTDNARGNQLIYVPVHTANNNLRASLKQNFAGISSQYIGKRYVTLDNTWYMPSYWLADVYAGRKMKFGNAELNLKFAVNNVFNTDFQVVANRPMPGRSYQFIVNILLAKKIRDNND